MGINYIVDQVNLPNETKNVLFVIRSFFRYLLIFSFVPILLAIAFAYYFRMKENKKLDIYSATISFIETDKINRSASSIGAAQFPGFQLKSKGDMATSLKGILRSDKILSDALFASVSETEKEKLVNLYFRTYFPEKYEDIKITVFDLDSLTPDQIKYFNMIKLNINNEYNDLLTYDSENILRLTISTKDQDLSYSFVNNLYSSLSDFFDEVTTNTYNTTLKEMERSRDSTNRVLRIYNKQLAEVETSQNFRILPTEMLPNKELVEKIMLTEAQYYKMFAEVEAYKIRNKINQTIFTKLSSPLLPLPKISPDVKSKTIIGGVIGFAVGLLLLLIAYILRIVFSIYKKIDED